MKRQKIPAVVMVVVLLAVVLAVFGGRTITAQDTSDDKYTVQVPGGLAFSELGGTNAGRSSPSVTPANR